MKIIFIYYCIK